MYDLNQVGSFYMHPKMHDVWMEVLAKYYIKEKDAWSLKVRWWRKTRRMPSGRVYPKHMLHANPYRIRIPGSKFKEFKVVYEKVCGFNYWTT